MVSILLTILKILLIVIASVAGLIIALALIILFVPVRYRIRADKDSPASELSANAKISFLLHIFTLFVSYEDELSYGIKIFGHKLRDKEEKKPEKEESPHEVAEEEIPSENDFTIDWNEDVSEPEESAAAEPDDLSDVTVIDESEEEDDDLADKISRIIAKITGKYDEAKDKYERIRKDITFWKKMADDKRNKEAFALIKKETFRLLRKIAPKKIKGFVHFGFDDPATTGSILMYLAMIYPVLPRRFKIDPSFDDTDIYGSIDIKGRLMLIVPALSFLRLYFNKDCKRMYRLYKRHKEKQN